MKNLVLIFACAIFFIGCAKKHYSNSEKQVSDRSSTSVKEATDKFATSTDKSITVKAKRYDTSLMTIPDTISGTIDSRRLGTISYENDDMSLHLQTDTNGFVLATAVSKPRELRFKVDERTVTYNDISRTEKSGSTIDVKARTKTDSLSKSNAKQVDPSPVTDIFKRPVLIIMVILFIAGLIIFAYRKFKMIN